MCVHAPLVFSGTELYVCGHLSTVFQDDLLYSYLHCELTHFRLIWYSALQKANLIHMTYGTQANFNVWDQMYLPKSEAVKSPVPYGLYLFA